MFYFGKKQVLNQLDFLKQNTNKKHAFETSEAQHDLDFPQIKVKLRLLHFDLQELFVAFHFVHFELVTFLVIQNCISEYINTLVLPPHLTEQIFPLISRINFRDLIIPLFLFYLFLMNSQLHLALELFQHYVCFGALHLSILFHDRIHGPSQILVACDAIVHLLFSDNDGLVFYVMAFCNE